MKKYFFLLSLFFFARADAQLIFLRNDSIPVFSGATQLPYAWAGGMNFCQFSDIDLNQDGISDLFVFDRTGNKITTYINHGTANQIDYELASQYSYQFPLLHDWVLLRDYNCDGKEDIFTASGGASPGIKVYENISSMANGLQFQLVSSQLMSDFFPNSTHAHQPIWVTNVDIPAIRDVDHDGDLDVLTYDVSGVHVIFHRNMSVESGYNCDSLIFKNQTLCWGDFAENTLNASITINDSCSAPPVAHHTDNSVLHDMHNGSCLECINTDGDNDEDILIGDITNPFEVYARNGGDSSFAMMDLVDNQFPSYNTSENMNVWICGFHLDVDNDGKKDILFAPNAPNTSQNFNSAWLYKNTGTNNNVTVNFVQNNFLQDKMIEVGEGSFPRFFDYDNDGDQDLFIGNYGYYSSSSAYPSKIALYENQGTASNPSFKFITDDFAGLYSNTTNIFCPVPTFGDLDGDGDKDMIVGDAVGKLHYFRKDPGPANNFVLVQSNYQGIDVGNYATPQLVDVDRDGLPDLLIGEQSGNFNYYRNTGTSSAPVFTLVTQLFGNQIVNQTGYTTGYSVPFLWDSAGTYVLLSGSERGYIFRYDNIDGNLAGTFTLTDSLYVTFREGLRTAPWMADITNDSLPDLVLGNYAGGVSLFLGNINTGWNEEVAMENSIHLFPNPANNSFTLKTILPNEELPAKISVYGMDGKLLRTTMMNANEENFYSGDLANGIYVVAIETHSGKPVRKKLVIGH
ncbi:MAG: T9SS type A sorting domain-containing protein [Bacteroidetes bacterium]|nr:T9SS type A sorting domain-containing protein [Bacteroidota bacterium]